LEIFFETIDNCALTRYFKPIFEPNHGHEKRILLVNSCSNSSPRTQHPKLGFFCRNKLISGSDFGAGGGIRAHKSASFQKHFP